MKGISIRKILQAIIVLCLSVLLFSGYKMWQTHQQSKLFEDGNNLLSQEDYEGAITEYRKVFEESSEQNVKLIALRSIGRTYYFNLKNYEQALSAFKQLIETFPDNRFQEETMFRIAYCLSELGRKDEALEQYAALVERYPRGHYVSTSYFNQGTIYGNREDHDKARESYKKSAESTTDWKFQANIQARIGGIYSDQKDYDNAIATYRSLLNEYPESDFVAQAKYGIADSYFKTGKWDEAINSYEKVINEHRDAEEAKDVIPKCFYGLGKTYYQLSVKHMESGETEKGVERFKQALESYQETIDQFPQSYFSRYQIENELYLMGTESYSRKNYENTLAAFDKLVGSFPKSLHLEEASHYIGKVNYHLENYADARQVLRAFLQTFPRSKFRGEARLLIAKSYAEQNNKDYAQAYLNYDTLTTTEFQEYPDIQAESMYKAAHCLKELMGTDETSSGYDEVIGRYMEFMVRFPMSQYVVDVYFDLGGIYAKEKKYDFAMSQYESALASTEDPKRLAKIQLAIGRAYSAQGAEYDNEALQAYEKAVNAAEAAIEAANANPGIQKTQRERDIMNAKLDRVNARKNIADVYIRQKQWEKVRDVYKGFIEEYGEAGYIINDIINEEPITADFISFCARGVGLAYYKMNDFGKALEWYMKVITRKGFRSDNNVSTSVKEKDFRIDSLAPEVIHSAMRTLIKLNRIDELETVATTYVEELRDKSPILSAGAQLKFAHIKREEFAKYAKAATEYAKINDYRPVPYPKLNLIRLQGKYYEGLCYNELSRIHASDQKSQKAKAYQEGMEKVYQEAITLFDTSFQPLIDASIDASDIDKVLYDYYIKTATDYVEKIRVKLKGSEPESEDKTEDEMDKSDASDSSDALKESKTAKQLTAQEIADTGTNSTVFIKMKGTLEYESGKVVHDQNAGTGSGFFVTPDQTATNYIATNYHVIAPRYSRDRNGEVILIHPLRGTARLVGTDREYAIIGYTAIDVDRDLAIVKVNAFDVNPLILGDSSASSVKQGTTVYPIGNPVGLVNVVSDGKISSVQWVETIRGFLNNRSKLVHDVQQNDTPHKLIMMTAPISQGNSGGPVLNAEGEVIGISVGLRYGGQNLNYAVPVNDLKALLKRVGSPKPLSDLEVVYNESGP